MSQFGDFDGDNKEPRDDEDIHEFYVRLRDKQISKKTKEGVNTAFAALSRYLEEEDIEIFDIDEDKALDWCEWMVNSEGLEPSTAKKYTQRVARVIDELKTDNYIGGNERPFREAIETDPFDYDENKQNWPEIDYDAFVVAIRDIKHPRRLAIVVVSAKTGIRIAELSNLDEQDIYINHQMSSAIDDPRPEIAERPNSIYIDSSINAGMEYNGETRDASNKEKSHRAIPIDQETADVLGWYLACRPQPSSPANPIFTAIDPLGERLGTQGIEDEVNPWAEKNGWRDSEPKVSHHFFRHWNGTQLRERLDSDDIPIGTPKRVVKGLRGDSDSDTIDTYTHDWTDGIESDYPSYGELVRSALPKFF